MWYSFFLKNYGNNNIIAKPILRTPEYIILKNNISIRNNARIEGVFTNAGINYDPVIFINNNVNIEQNLHLICANKITIGKDTAISANVTITDIIHPFDNVGVIHKK